MDQRKRIILLIVLSSILFISLFYYWIGKTHLTSPKNDINLNSDEASKENFCQIDTDYQMSVNCQCPEGYSLVSRMGWGTCPNQGMRDCPQAFKRCEKNKNINENLSATPIYDWSIEVIVCRECSP